MTLRGAALLAASLALTACVALPPKAAAPSSIDTAADWPARRAALLSLQEFALRGRVAVAAGEEGFNATLRWSQHGVSTRMQLEGPLGVEALRVEFDQDRMQVVDSHGTELADAAARAELERRLGFALPLRELAYWIRGVPAPSSVGIEVLDAQGVHLAALEQLGWRVEFAGYSASPLGELPRKLTARREGWRIRLVVDRWGVP